MNQFYTWRQVIIWTNDDILPIRHIAMKYYLKLKSFYSRKCSGKYPLRIGGHFVSVLPPKLSWSLLHWTINQTNGTSLSIKSWGSNFTKVSNQNTFCFKKMHIEMLSAQSAMLYQALMSYIAKSSVLPVQQYLFLTPVLQWWICHWDWSWSHTDAHDVASTPVPLSQL